jgi:hypothetical protein
MSSAVQIARFSETMAPRTKYWLSRVHAEHSAPPAEPAQGQRQVLLRRQCEPV